MRAPSPNHWTPGNSLHQAFCRTYPVEHASSRNLLLQVLFLAWHMNYYRFQCLFQQPEEFQWHSFGFSLKNSLKGLIPIVRQHFLFWDCSVAEKCLLYWFFSLWQASISWSSGPHFHYSFLFHGWRDSDTWTGSYSIFPPLYPLIIRLWPIAGSALEDSWCEQVKKALAGRKSKPVFIAEGLFMYFTLEQIRTFLKILKNNFPDGGLLIAEQNGRFLQKNEKHHDSTCNSNRRVRGQRDRCQYRAG